MSLGMRVFLVALAVSAAALPPAAAAPAQIVPAAFRAVSPPNASRAEEILTDLAVLTHLPDRAAGTFGERWAAVYVAHRLRSNRPQSETVALTGGGTTRNLWVTFGNGPTRLMLGAHYDTVSGSPGADDNAGGVAVLLALIPGLSSGVPAGLEVTLAFFGAEEFQHSDGHPSAHHQGSAARAARLEAEARLPDLMISVDMAGVGSDLLAVTLELGGNDAAELLTRAGARAGMRVRRAVGGDISDHGPFAAAGVAAVMLWRPNNPAHHRLDDTEVSLDMLLDDVRLLTAAVELAAGVGAGLPAAALSRFRPLRV